MRERLPVGQAVTDIIEALLDLSSRAWQDAQRPGVCESDRRRFIHIHKRLVMLVDTL